MARLIRDSLHHRGFDVFMDVEDLRSGKFNEALLREIDESKDFVVILSPDSLERCFSEGDWLRWEVAHAIAGGKNVVTVMTRGFAWPAEPLPPDLEPLPYYQGIEPTHSLFGASMDKLATLLKSRPSLWSSRLVRWGLAAACVAALATAGVLLTRGNHETSADSNYAFARDLCFNQDDWKKGAPLLAGRKGLLQEAATGEARGPGKSGEAELARLWQDAAGKVGLPDKWHCYRRARYWLRKALENPDIQKDGKAAEAIRAEMERIPALKASLRLKGESTFRESLVAQRSSMRWFTESGSGPFEIAGTTTLPAFHFEYGKRDSHGFSAAETRAVLPEGIDFTTAKIESATFGGKTGGVSRVLDFQISPDGNGIEIKFGEKASYLGTFNFHIVISFGN